MFPYLTYTPPPRSLFPKKINTGFIYTMNARQEGMKPSGQEGRVTRNERLLQMLFGASESLFSFDTYQFEDYSKVVADLFDPEEKAKRRREIFPKDCEKAFEMGVKSRPRWATHVRVMWATHVRVVWATLIKRSVF